MGGVKNKELKKKAQHVYTCGAGRRALPVPAGRSSRGARPAAARRASAGREAGAAARAPPSSTSATRSWPARTATARSSRHGGRPRRAAAAPPASRAAPGPGRAARPGAQVQRFREHLQSKHPEAGAAAPDAGGGAEADPAAAAPAPAPAPPPPPPQVGPLARPRCAARPRAGRRARGGSRAQGAFIAGKTPKMLLSDWCQQNRRPRPRFRTGADPAAPGAFTAKARPRPARACVTWPCARQGRPAHTQGAGGPRLPQPDPACEWPHAGARGRMARGRHARTMAPHAASDHPPPKNKACPASTAGVHAPGAPAGAMRGSAHAGGPAGRQGGDA